MISSVNSAMSYQSYQSVSRSTSQASAVATDSDGDNDNSRRGGWRETLARFQLLSVTASTRQPEYRQKKQLITFAHSPPLRWAFLLQLTLHILLQALRGKLSRYTLVSFYQTAVDIHVKTYQFAIVISACVAFCNPVWAGDSSTYKYDSKQEMKQDPGKGIHVLRWLRPCQGKPGKRTFKSWRWCPAG
jgi:hypothetical protein